MTHTFAATPARSRTLPRASRAPHSKNPLTSTFSEKIQITSACRLINRDVPQEVVRVLLDHESTEMTAHYARITDQTVRRHGKKATKVDINGNESGIDREVRLPEPNGPRPVTARHPDLPNGYCGLPLQRSCPHANGPDLPSLQHRTGVPPELREQRRRTLTLHTDGVTTIPPDAPTRTDAPCQPCHVFRSRLTGGVNRFGRRFPRRSGKSEEGAYVRVEEGIACRAAARTDR